MQLKRVKVRKRRRKRGRRKQHVHPGRQNLVCSGHSRHAEANQLVQIPQAAAPVSVSHTPVFARLLCALESLVPSTAAIDEVDPTRLGGRFPLPVGQPAADVLARYHVELIGDASHHEFLKPAFEGRTVVGLRIVPRDDVPTADDFKHVDLWYDTANWLPVGVAMLDEEGNTRRLRLSDARVNPELDEEQLRRLAGTVPTTADWVVDERRCPEDVQPAGAGE